MPTDIIGPVTLDTGGLFGPVLYILPYLYDQITDEILEDEFLDLNYQLLILAKDDQITEELWDMDAIIPFTLSLSRGPAVVY